MSLVISKVFTYDTDAGNYIQAVEGPAGDNQALEPAVRQAINNFVIGCKQDGIWSAIKASCILAGARTLNGALVPLAGTAPTSFNFVAGDYNRKIGLVGDGSTKYLNSNRNNNADPQNNSHMSLYCTAVTNTTSGLMGGRSAVNNTGTNQLNWIASTGTEIRLRSTTADIVTPSTAVTGFYGVSRSSSASLSARINGVTSVLSRVSDGLDDANIFVFARNTGGTALIHSNWRLAFYSIGESLDLQKLDSRVTDLITAFGAAIP